MELETVLADLAEESAGLDRLVSDRLDDWGWATPASGWTVAHQIAHLAWTDRAATTAARAPGEFTALVEAAMADPDGFVDRATEVDAAAAITGLGGSAEGAARLLETWRRDRTALQDALRAVPAGERVPWFGPAMSTASMATARLMETWAHGQDVADAFGVERAATDRIRHVAHIAVRARAFAYAVNALPVPDAEVRVELTAPSGEVWTWGPADALQRIWGPAEDFCLLSTQRRHRDDLDLHAEGVDAEHWLSIAQAFAGPPGGGRDPLV